MTTVPAIGPPFLRRRVATSLHNRSAAQPMRDRQFRKEQKPMRNEERVHRAKQRAICVQVEPLRRSGAIPTSNSSETGTPENFVDPTLSRGALLRLLVPHHCALRKSRIADEQWNRLDSIQQRARLL